MHYFAYGSNLSLRRLRARVPSATPLGNAVLYGHQLRFHKRGRDGSAKCDAITTLAPDQRVLGVVFDIASTHKSDLDLVEGVGQGYETKTVRVELAYGGWLEAFTYSATLIDPKLKPYDWYKAHVLRGALEHQLAADYIQSIQDIESIPDPDQERHAREMLIYR